MDGLFLLSIFVLFLLSIFVLFWVALRVLFYTVHYCFINYIMIPIFGCPHIYSSNFCLGLGAPVHMEVLVVEFNTRFLCRSGVFVFEPEISIVSYLAHSLPLPVINFCLACMLVITASFPGDRNYHCSPCDQSVLYLKTQLV